MLLKRRKQSGHGTSIYNIPLVIYQTYAHDDFPLNMKKNINALLLQNPEFDYRFYDDDDCRNFLVEHYGEEFGLLFDTLIPGAYKSDLWRYCVLYKFGGIYLDIKCKLNRRLVDFLNESAGPIFVQDADCWPSYAWNGFMATEPKNHLLGYCVAICKNNIDNRRYGPNYLSVTGPAVLGRVIRMFSPQYTFRYQFDSYKIYDKASKELVITEYDEYRGEYEHSRPAAYYVDLWSDKAIFSEKEETGRSILDGHIFSQKPVSLDTFNGIFHANLVTLPRCMMAFGVDQSGKLYSHTTSRNFQLVDDRIRTFTEFWKECIHPRLQLSHPYYFVICINDGYGERIYYYDGPLEYYMAEKEEFANKDEIGSSDPKRMPILHPHKIVLSFSARNNDPYSICIPDYFFMKYKGHLRLLEEMDADRVAWDQKIAKAVWRGDAQKGTVHNWILGGPEKNTGPREDFVGRKWPLVDNSAEPLSRVEQSRYKYILDIDGFANAWDETFWKLYSGSVVLKVKSFWKQWYYGALKEWVHYVPVAQDYSDLEEKIQWCINHDEECKAIVRAAEAFVREKLAWDSVVDDTVRVIQDLYDAQKETGTA